MEKIIKYIGLDVNKTSISIAFADQGRNGDKERGRNNFPNYAS